MPFDAREGGGRQSPPMKLVAGNSNRPLADAISAYLKAPLTKSQVQTLRRHGDFR